MPCAVLAQAEELQPMFGDLETGILLHLGDQQTQLIAAEMGHPPTIVAHEQVLVAGPFGDERLAIIGPVDALDEV